MVDMIEGHPIPQDITGFQFRLIGDMTVKQFGYLALSLIFGWLFFSLPENVVLKVLLGFIPVSIGLILAFIPIQGLPADTMIMLFFKALFNPNQYIYSKVGKDIPSTQQPQKATVVNATVTTNIHTQDKTPPTTSATTTPEEKVNFILAPAASPQPQQTQPAPPSRPLLVAQQIPTPPTQQAPPPEEKTQVIQESKPQEVVQPQPVVATVTPPPPQTIPQVPVQNPSPPAQAKTEEQSKKTPTTPFMPDVPNLIAGLIKDSRGNVLPNILVEVKDKEDNPVRAFKTNALGQFASATPLLNGTYNVTFEDPKKQHRFDIIELQVTGVIIPPLEIISIDEREELRKSLFQP